jgi:hypothetical protein
MREESWIESAIAVGIGVATIIAIYVMVASW